MFQLLHSTHSYDFILFYFFFKIIDILLDVLFKDLQNNTYLNVHFLKNVNKRERNCFFRIK